MYLVQVHLVQLLRKLYNRRFINLEFFYRLQQPDVRVREPRRDIRPVNNKPGAKKPLDNKQKPHDNKRVNNEVGYLIFFEENNFIDFLGEKISTYRC